MVIGWNPFPCNGNMNKQNEGWRFRSSAWFIMFWPNKKTSGFSFKSKEFGNPLHQCLVQVTFSSSPFNISIICGPSINQVSSNFPKCLRFFTCSAYHMTTFPSWSQPSIWDFPIIFMFKPFLHSNELCHDYFFLMTMQILMLALI